MEAHDINAIRQKTSIVDIISRYLNVIRKGKNYMAVCPFHSDNNPSLTISTDKQIFKCFVCGTGGNAFTFVQLYERISFIEAVYKVADFAGIAIKKDSKYIPKYSSEDEQLFKINEQVQKFFEFNRVNSPADSTISKYLAKREITPQLAKEFKLGYAPSNDNLITFLTQQGFSGHELIKAGIAYDKDGKLYSRYRNRLMFAITNNKQIVGFSGRRLDDSDEPKYINSPESRIFKKNEILYNFDEARLNCLRSKELFVVEGFMDVIALRKADYLNVVATMGTAFTDEHLKKLKSVNATIILAFDGDEAGQLATLNGLNKGLDRLDIRVVDYKNTKDPDEILKDEGSNGLTELLKRTISPIDFFFKYYLARLENATLEKKNEIFKILIAKVAALDGIMQLDYTKKIASIGNYRIEKIEQLIDEASTKRNSKTQKIYNHSKTKIKKPRSELMGCDLISKLIYNLDARSSYLRNQGWPLIKASHRELASRLMDESGGNKPEVADVITDLCIEGKQDYADELIDIYDNSRPKGSFDESLLTIYMQTVKLEKDEEQIKKEIPTKENIEDIFGRRAHNRNEKLKNK